MNTCAKGCGRQVKIRGMCNNHYQAKRTKWIRANVWQGPIPITGTSRRLRALCALGWPQAELAARTGIPECTVSHLVRGDINRTSRRNATLVCDLYDRPSGTPGPSEWQRVRARSAGWAPPLAWDDDTIDNPDAAPCLGGRTTAPWDESYRELRDMGLSDRDIIARWNIQPTSLIRQLRRYGIPQSAELKAMMSDRQAHRGAS